MESANFRTPKLSFYVGLGIGSVVGWIVLFLISVTFFWHSLESEIQDTIRGFDDWQGKSKSDKMAVSAFLRKRRKVFFSVAETFSSRHRQSYDHPCRVFDFDDRIQKQLNGKVAKNPLLATSTLFVSISSYRDRELCHTLDDLWAKAYNNRRIVIGIVQQNDKSDPSMAFANNSTVPKDKIRLVEMHYVEAKGPTHARSICEGLLKSEEYYMLIDSHMRFEQGWDVELLYDLSLCPRPLRTVLTAYPEGYQRHDEGQIVRWKIEKRRGPRKARFRDFTPEGIATFESYGADLIPRVPDYTPFWGACFSFCSSDAVREVPYDPHTPYLFFGEEIAMAARLFTHGWDLRTPRKNMVYHHWKRDYRKTYWEHDIIVQRDASIRRILDMLNGKDTGKWSLGKKRSIEDYYRYCGVDLNRKVLLQNRLRWKKPRKVP